METRTYPPKTDPRWRMLKAGDPVPTGKTVVRVPGFEPRLASEFGDWVLPGGTPFLSGISALLPVYVLEPALDSRGRFRVVRPS